MEDFHRGESMKHGKQELRALLLVVTGLFFAASLHGQSVADLARQTRTQKSGGSPRVFTNDNVARSAPAPPAPAPPAEKTPEELEKEYRAKFAALRENLSLEERKLDILQRELNLMQTQYDSDPQRTLTQELTRSNINTRVTEIETQKAAVDKAKQAVAALEEELRVKGLPPGWAR